MRQDNEGRVKYVNALITSFLDYNFNVYTGAYSKFHESKLSIPSILNFSETGEIYIENYYKEPPNINMKENLTFKFLSQQGYNINVYGDYLSYCKPNKFKITKCVKYRNRVLFNTTHAVEDKLILIVDDFLRKTRILSFYNFISNKLNFIPQYNWNMPVTDAHITTSIRAFDLLQNDVIKSKPGDAFFAHLTFPHSPYLYNKNCFREFFHGYKKNNSSEELMMEQVKCAQLKVENC